MRIVSVFTGCGGLDLGFHMYGGGDNEILVAVDIKQDAVETFVENICPYLKLETDRGSDLIRAEPGTAYVASISRIAFERLAEQQVDLVIGGPPCQDYSIVRGPKREGASTHRGKLIFEFVRVLEEVQPTAFVFENVPDLVNTNEGADYADLLKRIEASGFRALFSEVVDFSEYGVPQKRERLIIIGVKQEYYSPALQKLAKDLMDGFKWKFPLTPIEVIEGRPLNRLNEKYLQIIERWIEHLAQINEDSRFSSYACTLIKETYFDVTKDYLSNLGLHQNALKDLLKDIERRSEVLNLLGYDRNPAEKNYKDDTNIPPKEKASTIERMKRIPPGKNHEFVRGTKHEVKGHMSNIYRRIHPLIPAPTVIAHGGGGTHGYHYELDRSCLSLRERARLQTFPDWFVFKGNSSQIRSQIGEAVPPLASYYIAQAVDRIFTELQRGENNRNQTEDTHHTEEYSCTLFCRGQ